MLQGCGAEEPASGTVNDRQGCPTGPCSRDHKQTDAALVLYALEMHMGTNERLAGLGFFCVLAAYFVLLPLREDAVLQLGTDRIPALFASSLLATAAVSPIAAVVGRRVLYAFALSLIGLYMLATSTWVLPSRPEPEEAPLRVQPWVSALLYVTVNLMNLVATSTLWALCAKCFSPEAAKKTYGLLSAGATCGQLAGSTAALAITNVLPSAALLLVAAKCMRHMTPPGQPHADQAPNAGVTDPVKPNEAQASERGLLAHHHSGRRSRHLYERARQAQSSVRLYVANCVRIMAQCTTSPYLLQLHSAERLRFFAVLNSITALLILVLQVSLTAAMIRMLGVAGAACTSPALSVLGFAVIAIRPVPNMVAGVEVIRKVVQYALAKPTREVLFTVLTPAELSCKVMIDSLVGRAGDTVAAAVFQLVGVRLRWGPSRLAALGSCLCACWLLLTLRLGMSFKARQARLLPVLAGKT